MTPRQDLAYIQKQISYLTQFISENRKQRFDEVIEERTAHIRIVLEDIYQAHNASAVLRSCDCFGLQHVHFIENRNALKISEDVAMGSGNWLSIHRHSGQENNTLSCLEELKSMGYRIVATTPHKNDCTLDRLPVNDKFALVFGTEIDGVSPLVFEQADEFVKIPMFGFTESFNISVCAALCMYELSTRLRNSGIAYQLDEEEKTLIYRDWLLGSISKGDLILRDFDKKMQVK